MAVPGGVSHNSISLSLLNNAIKLAAIFLFQTTRVENLIIKEQLRFKKRKSISR